MAPVVAVAVARSASSNAAPTVAAKRVSASSACWVRSEGRSTSTSSRPLSGLRPTMARIALDRGASPGAVGQRLGHLYSDTMLEVFPHFLDDCDDDTQEGGTT
jgi:hypothetical protein